MRYVEIVNVSSVDTFEVVVRQNVSGTPRVARTFSLAPKESIFYNGADGWRVINSNGSLRTNVETFGTYGQAVNIWKTGTAPDSAGYYYCHIKDAGLPGAFTFGTPGLNGRAVNGRSEVGVPYLPAPAGNYYLKDINVASTVAALQQLYDLLWINSGIVVTTTTAQAITTPTWPARDTEGGTTGVGCRIGLIWVAASTNASTITNATVSYTNSGGVPGRTAALANLAGGNIPASPTIGTVVWFFLQAGDVGVQSIQSVTLGTSLVTGTVALCVARHICTLPTGVVNTATTAKIPKAGIFIGSDPCLFQAFQATTTTANTTTTCIFVEDR